MFRWVGGSKKRIGIYKIVRSCFRGWRDIFFFLRVEMYIIFIYEKEILRKLYVD